MLKRISWQSGKVLSLKLREDLYTLAQMREGYCLECFDICNQTGEWAGVDLTKTELLFTIITAHRALSTLAVAELSPAQASPNQRPTGKIMLSAVLGNNGNHGADLIELTDPYESYEGTILKQGLTLEDDLETIYKYEITGMVGSPDKIRSRLIRYFETGVNWDESKTFLFKGIQPPPAIRVMKKREAMEITELSASRQSEFMVEEEPDLLGRTRSILDDLVIRLSSLPKGSSCDEKKLAFKACIEEINTYEDEIETEERGHSSRHLRDWQDCRAFS